MKRTALAIFLVAIIVLPIAAWFIHNQNSNLQSQITELQTQNNDLQNQTSILQYQLGQLQLQNREQQDRLKDFTGQLAHERHLRVEITAFSWLGGFHPIVGVTLEHPINVTIQNNDVIPVSGLTLTFHLQQKGLGTNIGTDGGTRIERLNSGESRQFSGWVLTTIGTNLDNAECVVTLTVGDIVLDEGTYSLS
jgi:hypothetical protein